MDWWKRRDKDNDHANSGKLPQRGQYRIQYVMMMIVFASKIATISRLQSAVALRKQLRNSFGSCSTWKKLAFSLVQFYDAAKAGKKPSLKQIKH